MLRVLLTLMLIAAWLGPSARGAATAYIPEPSSPQNQAPQTVSYIDVGPLYAGGSSAIVDASDYFSDPDNDTLTYSVNNPSPSVAAVSISGSTVTVGPVAVGTTGKIIVTAKDPGGLTATQDFNVTVQNPPPPNRAPRAAGSISNVTVQVGGSAATRSVSGKFSDPDNDTLTYTVNNPNPSVAAVSISGSTVTVGPVAVGTTGKIIVTATDPGGLTATQDFTATVEAAPPPPPPPPPANRVPTAVGTISNVTVQVGGTSATRSVSDKFSDPDNDALTYSVNNPNPSIASVSIAGSTVTVGPVAVGTTGKIIVTATDPGGLTATQDFTATVEAAPPPPPPVNRAPTTVSSITDVLLSKGGSLATRSVSGKFSDPDNDALTYSVNNPNPSIATVSIAGSTVTISPVAKGSTGKIIVTATDPGGLTATQDFTATVINDPPRPVGSISDVTLYKNGNTRRIPVSGKFSDPNGDALKYSVSSNNTSVATASVSGSKVTVRSGASGTAEITVTATDPDEATVTQDFDVSVVNRFPGLRKVIPKMTFHREQAAQSVNASDHFNDPDNDPLTYTASSGNTSVATVSVSGSNVSVSPGKLGTTSITVTASDTDNARRPHSFNVEVVNRPPVVSRGIPDRRLNKNRSTSINVSSYFSDPDGDGMTFSARSSNTRMVRVSVSGSYLTIESEDDGGNPTVTVTATDSHDDSVSTDFTVTVVNRSPQARGSIGPVSLFKNSHTQDIDVSGKFYDPDRDTLRFTASSDDTAVATASVSGSTVRITSGNSGSATITVKAEDNDRASAKRDISVTVSNRAPRVTDSFEQVDLRVGGPSKRFDVSGHFSDDDRDSLFFSVNNPKPAVAPVSITGSEVTVAPKSAGEIGKVNVTATDTEGAFISEDFRVVVRPKRTPPSCPAANTVSVTVPPVSAGGDSVTMDVSAYFTIPEGVTATYEVNDPNPNVATFSVSGDTLTISPQMQGYIGNVNITAKANACADVSRAFELSVRPAVVRPPPPCPTANTEAIVVPAVSAGGDSATMDVSAYFTIPEGVTPTYAVNNPDSAIANVSISGDTLTIEPRTRGDTGKVVVSASATGCTDATRDFNITVGPAKPVTPPSCPTVNTEDIEVPFICAGGDSVTMDASAYFTIPEGVTPIYAVNNPDSTIANVSISGDTLTIEPKTQGHTGKVIITAGATGCADVTRDFNITVAVAPSTFECPAVKQMHPSRDVLLTVGGNDFEVNLTSHFTNLASSDINYSIESSNGSVATASRTDSTLVISPGTAGTARVTVSVSRCGCGTAASQVFNVTVEPTCPSADSNNPILSQTLTVEGNDKVIDLSGHFINVSGGDITYTARSADTTVVSVSNSGASLTISAKGDGMATVTVAAGKSKCTPATQSFNVTVSSTPPPEPKVYRVIVSPASVSIEEGSTQQFTASALDSAGTQIADKTFTWTSSDTSVATIDTSGLATAKDAGSTMIAASVDGVSGTASLTVTDPRFPPDVDRVIVSPASVSIEEGSTQQFTATALDSMNTVLADKTFTWTSSDTSVATIDTSGLATAKDAGSTMIAASVDGVSGTASLTVTEPTEPPPPTCPASVGGIGDRALTVGGEAARIDLSTYFYLPAGFTPNYVVGSTNAAVATTSLAGNSLTVTPVASGTDTVSVSVGKQDCDAVKQSFVVMVEDAPTPRTCPAAIVDASIPHQVLFAGSGKSRIDLTGHFEHIDQDGIVITVTSPSPETAVLSLVDSALKIDPKSAGRIDSVTVAVTDTSENDACDTVSLSFMITVLDPNSTPWSVSGERIYLLDGKVGIGEGSPDQKLVVDGKIRAEEVYVPMTPADYVFETDYELMPLENVARHIRDHGHLPGVASGAEMKADGIALGRMQTLLLEKIEELTLHVIAQHGQLRAQGYTIDTQQRRIEEQNLRIRQLDHRLEKLEQ